MKTSKIPRRALFLLTAIALLVCGIFLTRTSMKKAKTGAEVPISRQNAPESGTDAAAIPTPSGERGEPSITYVSQDGGETLKLVMDRFVARTAAGKDEIVALIPPATPDTLAKRLAEHEAPRGIFPLAYDESDTYDGLRTITSEIRAKMPREEAVIFARENGLTISSLPDYAPDWVIFAAADPFDALEKIAAVRSEPQVEAADVLTGRRPITMAMPNDPLVVKQWHHKATGAALPGSDMNVEGAWNYGGTGGVLGRGIKIGIIDTGIQNGHPDFVGNIDTTIDKDFITGGANSDPVYADEDHGTAVGGKAGARGNNALGVSGVAPEATLVGSRLITGDFTTDSQNAQALAHRVDVIHIKNNSWGYSGSLYKTEPLLEAALKNSSESGRDGKGTIFAFAAGNSAAEEDSANYSELTSSIYTITVGATSSKLNRCFYSEPGANVVIAAPSGKAAGHPQDDGGLGITTADRTGRDGYNNTTGTAGDYTDGFNGTSSSCPAVSGAIALMLEKNPNLGWRDVQAILIRSAKKIKPLDSGWATNAAGLHFNNDFGAGLIDATAAVNMAGTWTNLGPHTALPSTKTGLSLTIPDNSSTGRDVLFNLPGSNIITEHVTVRVTIDHTARGHLEITLFSPSGTASRLAEVRSDLGQNYSDYTFSTVRNWGENSSGTWTLKVADRKSGNSNNGGTIRAAEIVVYGVFAPPVNPPPDVRITAPAEGSIFSPGVGFNVNVDATDLDIDSNPKTVKRVDLYQNNVLVATDNTAPYQFPRNPANGFYTYVAKATDSDDLEGESAPVFLVVRNQTPVIASATLNAGSQAYDDLPLTVTNVSATDPENDPITFSYRWEFSVDEENYTNSGLTGATLAPNPDQGGKLWRCAITASDNNMNVSLPYYTAPVNLLDRPSGLPVRPGGGYTYQSGLVLKGDTLIIDRQAIVHEFSQGPLGGTSEWIEILTLQAGSLSGWTLADAGGNTMTFASGAWDNIPAGTLIVVYNGEKPKDPLLPADSSDPNTGAMVVSSADKAFFTESSIRPSLDNLGDSIYIKNGVGLSVHQVSYGNSVFANPNVGRVESGEAAYFAGQSDAGASLSNEWLRTTSSTKRTSSFSAAAPLAIFPGAIFTNGQYRQDFDTFPGADGTDFPTGWSGYTVSIANTQTTNFDNLLLSSEVTSQGGVFNFGSRIGILGGSTLVGGNRFDPGFFALALDNTRNLTGLQISYDIIKMSELPNSRSMLVTLEYTTGNPQNTGTQWVPIAGTSHLTGTLPRNTVTRLNNVTLPAIFTNRESPIYLRWYYRTDPGGSGGAGVRDAIAIDNLVISSDSSPNIFMSMALNPSTISEAAGANASVGTVTISKALSIALTVGISSSDTGEATVPSSVVIPAGQLSATFPIAAVDDILADGTQSSMITLSAPGFLNVSKPITITDNEPIQIGVTPAMPNNVSNAEFVARIREGRLTEAATYRLADGSLLPQGLSLSTTTGLISGTISPSAALGNYTVIIERRNVLGGFTSQTIVIVVSQSAAISYSEWVGGSGVADVTVGGDSDLDSLPNLVEYALGSLPNSFDNPAPVITDKDQNKIWITYTKSKNVVDVTLIVEWSPSLETASWANTGITHEILIDGVNSQTIRSSVTIDPSHPLKFLRLHASLPPPPE